MVAWYCRSRRDGFLKDGRKSGDLGLPSGRESHGFGLRMAPEPGLLTVTKMKSEDGPSGALGGGFQIGTSWLALSFVAIRRLS